jgi:phage shock protein E
MLNLSVNEFAEIITHEGVKILDVRTAEEVAEGYIDGARIIDFYQEDFENVIKALDKDFTYAIYCRSGKRSGEAAKIMDNAGFVSVFNLAGGMIDWNIAGMPIVGTN